MQIAYVALDPGGQRIEGSLETSDRTSAANDLRGRGLFPVELREGGAGSSGSGSESGFSLSWTRTSDKVLFLKQLALMLRTGLTLLQALDTLGARSSKRGLRRTAARLSHAVQAGESLSSALALESRLFPPLVEQLVRAAEATGELEQALVRAAEHLERRAALRAQLLTSMLYPALVILVTGGVFWLLTTQVVPKLARFLSQRQVALPWTTRTLMDVSAFLQTHGSSLVLAFAGLLAALAFARRTRRGRAVLDRAVLAVPLIGGLIRTAAQAHLSRTLSMLLRSGVPLLESLRILADSFQNQCYVRALERAQERIVRGASLATSLEGHTVSPLYLQVVAVGEETGALDQALEELASFYEERLQQAIRTLASLFEPAVILMVGGVVGFVYLSFFQAIFLLAVRH